MGLIVVGAGEGGIDEGGLDKKGKGVSKQTYENNLLTPPHFMSDIRSQASFRVN